MTTKNTAATAQATIDAISYALKAQGATWKFIATRHLGVSWDGANMDGGRALRSVNRAKKAQVDPTAVKIPAALLKELAKPATPVKAAPVKVEAKKAPVKRTRKAPAAAAAPVVADEAVEVKAAS